MKKIITSLLFILFTHVVLGQYFGEYTTYLVKTSSDNGQTMSTSGYLNDLVLLQKTNQVERYILALFDTIVVRNDSIIATPFPFNESSETYLIFDLSKQVGDTFLSTTKLGGFLTELKYIIDSIRNVNNLIHTYFHSLSPELQGFKEFVWVEGVGEVNYGVNYPQVFNLQDISHHYLAYCRNDIIKKMDGSPWGNIGDTNCSFSSSLKQLSIAVNQAPKSLVTVYPNPSSTIVTIQNFSATASYRIISALGQLCGSGSGVATIDIRNLENGLYIIEVLEGDTVTRATFLKE